MTKPDTIDTSAEAAERMAADLCARWDDAWALLDCRVKAAYLLRALAAERDRWQAQCEAAQSVCDSRGATIARLEDETIRRMAGASARGWAAAIERSAAEIMCGCINREQVARAASRSGPNSAARWNICGQPNCGALDAAAILTLRDRPEMK